jgi:hypothetical protein
MVDDGLAQEWSGRVWMNPPFSDYTPWAHKWIQLGNGIALSPIGVHTLWSSALWASAQGAVLMPPDIRFVSATGGATRIMFRCVLWAFGDWAVDAISRIGHVR